MSRGGQSYVNQNMKEVGNTYCAKLLALSGLFCPKLLPIKVVRAELRPRAGIYQSPVKFAAIAWDASDFEPKWATKKALTSQDPHSTNKETRYQKSCNGRHTRSRYSYFQKLSPTRKDLHGKCWPCIVWVYFPQRGFIMDISVLSVKRRYKILHLNYLNRLWNEVSKLMPIWHTLSCVHITDARGRIGGNRN